MDKILSWPGWVTVEQAAARVGTTPEAHSRADKRSGKIQAYYFATESETM